MDDSSEIQADTYLVTNPLEALDALDATNSNSAGHRFMSNVEILEDGSLRVGGNNLCGKTFVPPWPAFLQSRWTSIPHCWTDLRCYFYMSGCSNCPCVQGMVLDVGSM